MSEPTDDRPRRPIRSFVLRQGKMTDAQKRAFELHWPKYGADMLDGRTEINNWRFRRQTDGFSSRQIYEKGFAPRGVRTTPLEGSPLPDKSFDATSGSTELKFDLTQIAIGQEYGYRVDLIR